MNKEINKQITKLFLLSASIIMGLSAGPLPFNFGLPDAEAETINLAISSNETSGQAPLTVKFTATPSGGTGTGYKFTWNFADGTTSTEQNPTHQFSNAGTYVVLCKLKDSAGHTFSRHINITVTPQTNPQPTLSISISANQTLGINPLAINFSSTVNQKPVNNTPYEYFWDFGDGTNSTDTNPVHLFANTGTFLVKATVNDTLENTASSNTLTVTAYDSSQPPCTLQSSMDVYTSETFSVPDCVTNLVILIPDEAHEPDASGKTISPKNAHYLATNNIVSPNTSIIFLSNDKNHSHKEQAKRQDNNVIEWTSNAIAYASSSAPKMLTAGVSYDITDTTDAPMKGTITVRSSGQVQNSDLTVGLIYVPTGQLAKFNTMFTSKGFTINSEYNFTSVFTSNKALWDKTVIEYSTTGTLSSALSALSSIVTATPYA